MSFEWDNDKNQSNTTKHGISFEEAIAIFDDPHLLTFEDNRFEDGESRWISIGRILLITQEKMAIIVVVYTDRGEATRIISARKANEREKKRYERS